MMNNDNANIAEDSDRPATVQFDVGGTLFKTTRSLFRGSRHVERTMLGRLVSETWLLDPTKPVFIDRSAVLFGHVLDYLRYGSIALPVTISKDMFLRELDYYGVLPIDCSSTITTSAELHWADEVDKRHDDIEYIDKTIANLVERRRYLELCNNIDLLANHCSNEYINGSCIVDIYIPAAAMTNNNNNDHNTSNEGKIWNGAMAVCTCKNGSKEEEDDEEEQNMEIMLLQKSLSKFGLRLRDINIHGNRCTMLLERLSSSKTNWVV